MAVLVLVGAALRFYRLDEQSIWLDEYLSISNLGAESPIAALRFLKINYPEQGQCPLFYFVLYYWARIFGTSVVVLRVLPILVSLATIPLVYGIGRYMFSHRIAAIAALCFVLSPQHVWHAQEPRPYPLVLPLVIVALYALLRALRDRKLRWWLLNLTANTLLAWTHILAVLALLVQGLFMLVFYRRMFWRMTAWAIVQLALLAPWTVWMLNMPYVNELIGGGTVLDVVKEIFFDDIVLYHTDIRPPFKTNPPEYVGAFAARLLTVQPALNAMLVLLIGAAVAAFAFAPIAGRWRTAPERPDEAKRRREHWVLLLLLMIVPGAILGSFTLLLEVPLLGSMYALYNTLAIYIAIGCLIAAFSHRWLYRAGIVVLCVLYGYQLALILPETTRTNWLAVARHIEAKATPADRVYDIQLFGPGNYLPYNWPDMPLRLEIVWTPEAAVDRGTKFLDRAGDAGGGRAPGFWMGYEDRLFSYRWPAGGSLIEEALAKRNLAYKRTRFPGHDNVELIHAWRRPDVPLRTVDTPVPETDTLDYPALMETLNLTTDDGETTRNRLEALRHYVSIWPPVTRMFVFAQSSSALAGGEVAVAEALASWCVETSPEMGLGHLGLALARAAQGAPAREHFDRAFALHPGMSTMLGDYADALLDTEACDACLAEVAALEATGYVFFGPAMRAACWLRAGQPLPENVVRVRM